MRTDWWRAIEPDMWRFAGEPQRAAREDYAAILSALLRLSGQAPMSTLPEIADQMREDGYDASGAPELLRVRLDELVQTSLVLPFLSPSATREGLRDGHRRQEAWALSKEGRVVVRSIREAVDRLDRVLALPARLIDSIHDALRQLLVHVGQEPMRVALDIAAIRSHTTQLLDAAGDYYEAMRMLNQHDVTDDALFAESRTRIVLVLRQFVQHTQEALAPVRRSLDDARVVGFAAIAEAGAAGAGAVPTGNSRDWADDAVAELESLESWFMVGGNVDRLIDSAGWAIEALLSAISRRYRSVSRASDLAADFRRLAHMIYAQRDERDAAAVFAAATGLWAAQHPRLPDDDDDLRPLDAAALAPGHPVVVSLRSRPSAGPGTRRAQRLENLTASRELEEQAALAEMARLAALSADLVTPGVVDLSHFSGLDGAHLPVLSQLIEEAMDDYTPESGYGHAESLGCRLRLAPGAVGRLVRLAAADGRLTAPDTRIQIADLRTETKRADQ